MFNRRYRSFALASATALSVATLSLALGVPAAAADGIASQISKAVNQGDIDLMFRYRYETVDQDPFGKDADASTLLSRITMKSGMVRGFSGLVEVDNVSYLGNESFNNTANGKTQYPVIADPDYTEVNQAWLGYIINRNARISAGRQRISHSGERFLGSVAWRQHEQTFDSARAQLTPLPGLTVDYSYIWRIKRVFDPDTDLGDFPGNTALGEYEGDSHAVYANYDLGGSHNLAGFGYVLDIDELPNLSSRTWGIEYKGIAKVTADVSLGINLSAARQYDYGDSALDYSAPYYFGEVNAMMTPTRISGGTAQPIPLVFGVGYEVLGSDDGVSFQTPLATLHKFQGFADKFLVTPPNGIRDGYLKAGVTLYGVVFTAFYHDFEADRGSDDYGDEIDLVANYPINPNFSVMVKYASYQEGELASARDTDKLWLMLTATF